jgi:hypothetical protein
MLAPRKVASGKAALGFCELAPSLASLIRSQAELTWMIVRQFSAVLS